MPAALTGDRAAHFPAIERKHGEPVSHWLEVLSNLGARKYPEQIAYLRENFGFSQAHANAVVMYHRGSTSARRYTTLAQYLKTVTPEQRKTITNILTAITKKYPSAEVVISWNKPMVKLGDEYLFGVSALRNYLLLAPFRADVLEHFLPRLTQYRVNKKTFQVPSDWDVDGRLVADMVGYAIKHPVR